MAQRLTPEEVNKRAKAWYDSMLSAIEHGPTPGAIPAILKQFASKVNGRSLPKNRW